MSDPTERSENRVSTPPVLTPERIEKLLEEGRRLAAKVREELRPIFEIPVELMFQRLR